MIIDANRHHLGRLASVWRRSRFRARMFTIINAEKQWFQEPSKAFLWNSSSRLEVGDPIRGLSMSRMIDRLVRRTIEACCRGIIARKSSFKKIHVPSANPERKGAEVLKTNRRKKKNKYIWRYIARIRSINYESCKYCRKKKNRNRASTLKDGKGIVTVMARLLSFILLKCKLKIEEAITLSAPISK